MATLRGLGYLAGWRGRTIVRALSPLQTFRRYQSSDEIANLKAQVEKLIQQVDELQLHVDPMERQGRNKDPDQMSYSELTKERNQKYFTDSQRRVVELISLQEGAMPVGSFKYLAFAYPGDIDMCENLTWPSCTKEEASRRVAERFANIARRISLEPNIYLSDFKIGYDERLRIKISDAPGQFKVEHTRRQVADLREKNLIKSRSEESLQNLLDAFEQSRDDEERHVYWLDIRESIRQLYTLRWRLGELLIGRKRLADGTELPLWRAIYASPSVMKVDIWAEIIDDFGYLKFTEVTNFFMMSYTDSATGEMRPITKPFATTYAESITADIARYSSEESRNSMKLAKRLWLKAVLNEDVDMLRKLYPLFASAAAALSQVEAESFTLRDMIMKLSRRPAMVMPVLDRLLGQVMGFNKRIKSNIASEGNSPGLQGGNNMLYGIRKSPKALIYQHGLRNSVDTLLNPIYYEAKFQLADEGLHGGYLGATFAGRLNRLEELLHDAIEDYTSQYLIDHDIRT